MKYVVVASLLLTMLFVLQALAVAQPVIPLISASIRGGVGTYAMSDINVGINETNDGLLAARFDELKTFGSGPNAGGELRVLIRPHLALSATAEYLYQSAGVDLERVGEKFMRVEVHASTVPITGRVLYVVSNSKNPKLVYTMGGGISYLWLGRLKFGVPDLLYGTIYRTADGSGLGFQAVGGVEYFVLPWVSVGGELQYRYAKISELTDNFDGTPWLMSNGQKLTMDFSGVNFSACVRFHL
jgi:opacity protein-like surface antigen